ncbi:MAG: hypothetical protein PF636_03230 [Actinomycetota bacterium]|nr:hypothetical protein [Actinomycetota bacterium]
MDFKEALEKAAAIVEEAKIPDDLRVAAFEKTLESLTGPVPAPQAHCAPVQNENAQPASGELESIAQKLDVPLDVIAEVYEVSDGTLDVILGYSRLSPKMKAGTEQLAILIAAGRQAAGLDPDGWTTVGTIRDICKDFNKLDGPNFATTISSMDQWFSISGNGRNRRVKVSRAGWEHAKQVVITLTD